ncbi:MAG: ABC transporter permease [Actinomycetes bacterium]
MAHLRLMSGDDKKSGAPRTVVYGPRLQVFEPHRASLPPIRPYIREFWARKRFSLELAKFADKAEYLDSNLGKVWLVLNPLLLAFVYFLLVTVLRGGSDKAHGFTTLAHILIGLFTFYFAQNVISDGAQSITQGGRLILNQAFPRTLLPLSSAIRSFWQYLPTIPVYVGVVLIGKIFIPKADVHIFSWALLWVPYVTFCLALTAFGMALVFATMNVYFRDTSKLLSYTTRIWLYGSPVLWLPEMLHGWHRVILYLNPLGPALSATSEIWIRGHAPTLAQLIGLLVWALIAIVLGGYFFISRERDFAVRI